nr:MAG TPA: minor tail protein [Bacteriophage sp.]
MSGMATWKAKIELDIKDLQKQLIDADEKFDKFANEDRKVKLDIDTKTLESAIQKLNKMLDSLSKGTGDFKQFENLSKELSSIVSEVQNLSKAFGKVDDSGAKTLLSSIQNIDKSLSELSQNILNVNKNMNNMGGNTSGAVKQVENIGNAYQNAAKEAEKLADAQSKLGQKTNISSGMKDTFPKTSENLEQVAQSEQKIQQEARAIQSKWEQAEKAIQNYMNAVTKLNNLKASDKSTGKKSYEIVGQIEEIEKLKKEAYDARQVLSSMINPQNVDTDTWKRYVDVINRLDQASNGSAESVNRLKDSLKNTLNSELNSLQNSIDKYQNIITQAQTYPSDFHPSTEYNTKLANLESANNVLKNYKSSLQGVNELTKEQQAEINKLTQNCEKAATEFKKLSAAEKGTVEVGIEKAIQRINKDLAENTKYSAEAKAGFNVLLEQLKSGDPSINLRKITEEIIKIENAEIAAGRAGKSLWDIFKTKSTYGFIGQMQSYLSMYVGFYGMVNGVKKAVSTITELDTALVDLKKTTAMNENQLENFYYDSNNVAKQMGVTTQEIIDQASAWSRLGFSTNEAATEMAKLSSQFASISPGMSVDESQSGLVSIMKAWSINPDQVKSEIMDPINKLGKIIAQTYSNVWCYKNIA